MVLVARRLKAAENVVFTTSKLQLFSSPPDDGGIIWATMEYDTETSFRTEIKRGLV
eukprot:CAMPEP_0206326660 /NCGR_PEP_ID=MMETSP0106_2-20121207/21733_1 /ASSEMBLY_ACC=CAM_ASM_000206 /TAXON_ID=81532 /ORGANISM="Acanthoeca-like sp., Strain 10tr" /LENGTH=55 /DNA_ID=CAMNT_0053759225 /DNA_START=752 /DNA_END=919 /DNA_ORIENTATION=-